MRHTLPVEESEPRETGNVESINLKGTRSTDVSFLVAMLLMSGD